MKICLLLVRKKTPIAKDNIESEGIASTIGVVELGLQDSGAKLCSSNEGILPKSSDKKEKQIELSKESLKELDAEPGNEKITLKLVDKNEYKTENKPHQQECIKK